MKRWIRKNVLETIGNTPIVELSRVGQALEHEYFVKLESFNPGLSIKDRLAVHMIEQALISGELKQDGVIIETTSGNTGMGLALVGAVKGIKVIFAVPDKVSTEKINMLKAMGAQVVVCPSVQHDDPKSYYNVAKRMADQIPNSFYCNQYQNASNPEAHYQLTGPELFNQMEGNFDVFVSCIGTGGTITGISRYLKEQKSQIVTVGVDPIGSVYYDYFHQGKIVPQKKKYKVEGAGKDFIPGALDMKTIDEVIQVSDQQSFDTTIALAKDEGIFVGGSSGAAVAGMIEYSKRFSTKKRFVTILPDSGMKYLSKVFNPEWMKDHGFISTNDIDLSELPIDLLKNSEY